MERKGKDWHWSFCEVKLVYDFVCIKYAWVFNKWYGIFKLGLFHFSCGACGVRNTENLKFLHCLGWLLVGWLIAFSFFLYMEMEILCVYFSEV